MLPFRKKNEILWLLAHWFFFTLKVLAPIQRSVIFKANEETLFQFTSIFPQTCWHYWKTVYFLRTFKVISSTEIEVAKSYPSLFLQRVAEFLSSNKLRLIFVYKMNEPNSSSQLATKDFVLELSNCYVLPLSFYRR